MQGANQHIRSSLSFSILSTDTSTCGPGESNLWLKSASSQSEYQVGGRLDFAADSATVFSWHVTLLYMLKFRCTSDLPQIVELKTQRNGSICVNILTFSDQVILQRLRDLIVHN